MVYFNSRRGDKKNETSKEPCKIRGAFPSQVETPDQSAATLYLKMYTTPYMEIETIWSKSKQWPVRTNDFFVVYVGLPGGVL